MKEIIASLKPHITSASTVHLETEGAFAAALKAAFVKSFEFTELWANQTDETALNAYFHLGALRGICEDYIVLSFFLKLDKPNRDRAVNAYIAIKFCEATERQHDFFKSNRPFQPVIKPKSPEEQIRTNRAELKAIGKESGLWKENISVPKINWMANTLGLDEFYKFYYSTTSEAVHFNPRALLRMGWGDMENFTFSTTNFSTYYREFAITYSAVLLSKYVETFTEHLNLPVEAANTVEEIEKWLEQILRWPEPVTYEEMNSEGPSQFIRIMLRAMKSES